MTILGVVSASGGVGVSTVAAAIGMAAAQLERRCVLVDGDPHTGGAQVTMALEHSPGHRWSDLVEVDGEVSGERLLQHLPGAGGCAVLSAGRTSHALDRVVPEPVTSVVFDAVVDALERASDLVVIDWGRTWRPGFGAALLLAPVSARGLADAEVWTGRNGVEGVAGLVTRAPKADHAVADRLAGHLGLPLLGQVCDERRVRAAARSGSPPGLRRGPLARLARELVTAVTAVAERAPVSSPGERIGEAARGPATRPGRRRFAGGRAAGAR